MSGNLCVAPIGDHDPQSVRTRQSPRHFGDSEPYHLPTPLRPLVWLLLAPPGSSRERITHNETRHTPAPGREVIPFIGRSRDAMPQHARRLIRSSVRKRQSVIVRQPLTGAIVLYCKGADSAILDLLSRQFQRTKRGQRTIAKAHESLVS